MQNNKNCQLIFINSMSHSLNKIERLYQKCFRIKRILKRRICYLWNLMSELFNFKETLSSGLLRDANVSNLQPCTMVRVRSRDEIRATLDRWNQLSGCVFMEEMWQYCGTIQKVFKRIEQFLDERDYLVKKCSGLVILENVFCHGTKDFGKCDRTCFYFWREEWLLKLG